MSQNGFVTVGSDTVIVECLLCYFHTEGVFTLIISRKAINSVMLFGLQVVHVTCLEHWQSVYCGIQDCPVHGHT